MTTKTTNAATSPAGAKDVITLLEADHATVSGLFFDDEKVHFYAKKQALVAEICTELSVHAQIEEEIFYSVVKSAPKDKLLFPDVTAEQAGVKELIAQLEGLEPDGEMYDVKVKVLFEYVKHHIKEEQNEMFPKFSSASLNLIELGVRMATRKADLLVVRG